MLHRLNGGQGLAAAVETKSFEQNDYQRLIAWMGMDAPEFLGGHQVHNAAKEAAQSFLNAQSKKATHMAVHAKDGFCAQEFRKRAGFDLTGPIAAIDMRTGEAFIDPALKDHSGVNQIVAHVSMFYTPMALRA